jgi:hypothetical protein
MNEVNTHFDADVVSAASEVIDGCVRRVLGRAGEEYYYLLRAVAGAGKTEAVVRMARAARRRHVRLAVANPTNEQVFQTIRRLLTGLPSEVITYVPASSVEVSADIAAHPQVRITDAKNAGGCCLLVGTLRKLGDALCRSDLLPRDLLVIDEAYQADAASYFTVADLAPTHFLVGDSGQLEPFSSAPEPDLFRGLPHDPLQSAVGALRRHGRLTDEASTLCTYRLPGASAELARAFYPGVSFKPAVREGVRELRLGAAKGRGANAVYDGVLERAATSSLAHLELRGPGVPDDDPEIVNAVVGLVRRFYDRAPEIRCEWVGQLNRLGASDTAVVVSHRRQRGAIRAALANEGLGDVFVETANKIQGLEFATVFYWHSLASLSTADPFHLDPGRTCVGLTRHRHACVVVGREGDRALVEGFPPITPTYPDWDSDPVLDGWDIHRQIFSGLSQHRLALQ